jgi:hypothetical protein
MEQEVIANRMSPAQCVEKGEATLVGSECCSKRCSPKLLKCNTEMGEGNYDNEELTKGQETARSYDIIKPHCHPKAQSVAECDGGGSNIFKTMDASSGQKNREPKITP